jgi:hypothetical protein
MADFPFISVKGDKTSDHKLFKQVRNRPQVRTPFEDGAVQSRGKVTLSRWKFQVGGDLMTTVQMDTLTDFFDDNQGETFNFVHPIRGTSHVVRFSEDELPEAVPIGDGPNARWRIQGINLEEHTGSTVTVYTTTTTTTSSSTSSTASTTSSSSSTTSTTSTMSSTTSTTTTTA